MAGRAQIPRARTMGIVGVKAELAGGRILVVDDEVAWVEAIDSMLSGFRARVCGVTDPREAIVMARIYAFDVAIVDWSLEGGLTGFDLVRALRRFRPEMAWIILSGHGADTLRRQEPAARSVPILAKPFSSEALIGAVAAALRCGRGAGAEVSVPRPRAAAAGAPPADSAEARGAARPAAARRGR
jgi:CheY-like chemotaxis protein